MNNFDVQQIPIEIRPYFYEIAERLWSGHAAVMVGAGFSKNAQLKDISKKEFPDWNQLGNIFYEKIYGCKPNKEQHYLNVLKLANEVEAAFGRPVLDQILRVEIPNKEYEPSDLHIKLMELPWVDVFTTNYDTLLERTCDNVILQRFDIVTNKEDLVFSEKPRIIKLHGSFPSKRPFIITEEDYRKYPQNFAPFVNTVQQSLLENTLCLIGFSGDDPNFLQWIGWINDNMGRNNYPKIYLIGILNISDAHKKLLESRNIISIDLSKCTGVDGNHKKALNVFLEFLISQKEVKINLDWPDKQKFIIPRFNDKDYESQITKIISEWKNVRKKYPNWIILPEDRRNLLWINTEDWTYLLDQLEKVKDPYNIDFLYEVNWRFERCLIPIFNDIISVYENILKHYNPYPDVIDIKNSITSKEKKQNLLNWDDIRIKWVELYLSLFRFYREEGYTEKWEKTNKLFQKIYDSLSPEIIARLHYELCLNALFSLKQSDLKKAIQEWPVNSSLPLWETKRAGLLAEIGLIEDSEKILEQSLSFTRKKLNLSPVSSDYSWVSKESYIMQLLQFVKDAKFVPWNNKKIKISNEEIKTLFFKDFQENNFEHLNFIREKQNNINTVDRNVDSLWNEFISNKHKDGYLQKWQYYKNRVINEKREMERKKFNERWNYLKQYKCDPWGELKLFEIHLEKQYLSKQLITQKKEFDIDRIIKTRSFGGTDHDIEIAYSFLRYCEEVGIAFRIPGITFGKKSAEGALKRISNLSPYWALVTLVRIGDSKIVNTIYNRKSISQMSISQIDYLVEKYFLLIKTEMSRIKEINRFSMDNFLIIVTEIIPEILSRLCVKCSYESRYKLLIFFKELYLSKNKFYFKNISHLIKRLLSSFSYENFNKILPILIDFPILTNLNPIVEREFPEPFHFLEIIGKKDRSKYQSIKINNDIINRLISYIKKDTEEREKSVYRLVKLYQLNILNNKYKNLFANALWNKVDTEFGFPIKTGYFKFVFINLPHPENINPIKLLKEFILKKNFPIQQIDKDKGIPLSGGHVPFCNEILGGSRTYYSKRGIEWTQKEIIIIFNKIIHWWDSDKKFLKQDNSNSLFNDIPIEFKSRFMKLIPIISEVIAPHLSVKIDNEVKINLLRLLKEFDEFGIPCLNAKVACIHIFKENIQKIISDIHNAISSEDHLIIVDVINAILILLFSIKSPNEFNIDIFDIIHLLTQQIRWRRKISLVSSLNAMSTIIKIFPRYLNNKLLEDVLVGLKYLIHETKIVENDTDTEIIDKLEYRKASVHLSSYLSKYFSKKNEIIPDIINDWRNIYSNENEFTEIRNEWNND